MKNQANVTGTWRGLRTMAAITVGSGLALGTATTWPTFGVRSIHAQVRQMDEAPAGWFLAGTAPRNYRTGLNEEGGGAFLASRVAETGGFGTLMQSIDASHYAGQRVRLRGTLRSRDVNGWAGLWMRVDRGERAVAFDNMQDRAVTASRNASAYDVVLDVPADATGISFGLLLNGAGEVWMSDVHFDVVGRETPVTGLASRQAVKLPVTPANLELRR